MRNQHRLTALLLALILALSLTAPAWAADTALDSALTDTAQYVCRTVKAPQVGSIGGEWAVIGLARSNYEVPERYYQTYYAAVEQYVKDCGGVLHEKKYTEYSRVIVALSAIGRDARNVAGYDLTRALGDYDKTIWQGLNGPIWALIALDSRNYPVPENPEAKTQATRQMYIDRILSCQLPDGGWSLFGGTAAASDSVSDPDITGMALQALAKYQDQPAVAKATEEALNCMSRQQDKKGGFSSWGSANSESCVQIIVALCELGIPLDDPRFVKDGNTLLDNLLSFYRSGKGFLHTQGGSGNSQMATEQGLYALAAVQRAREGRNSLYRMGDVKAGGGAAENTEAVGLPGKNPAVQRTAVTAAGATFPDIAGHASQSAIEAMAARGIINGSNGQFAPEGTMTRAEFSAIVVRALGLTPDAAGGDFTDVAKTAWYAGYVGTASSLGIINGVGAGRFNPGGTITRQEAAVMVSRAAKLCGMDTALDTGAVRDVLAQFTDYVEVPEWTRPGLAFCFREGILDDSVLSIRGTETVRRCEVAEMLYHLLGGARLL